MAELRIGVVGAAGRMGQMLVRAVASTPGCTLAGATGRPGTPVIGRDVGEAAQLGRSLGVTVVDDPAALFETADAVLDFSTPGAAVQHARLAAARGRILVVGTTGLAADQEAALAEAARSTAIVYAPNTSVVVTAFLAVVEQLAGILGADYDAEILELHHKHKVDAPSGTAVGLGRAVARGRGQQLEDVAAWARHGHTGPRRPGDIGFAVMRGADVVGEHTVMFLGPGERLEVSHRCTDRGIYARGAVRAALWAQGRPPGLYGMPDVLDLRKPA